MKFDRKIVFPLGLVFGSVGLALNYFYGLNDFLYGTLLGTEIGILSIQLVSNRKLSRKG
ncbi:hypothetical protein ACNR9Q_01895 [Maribacter sp. X9]|uniref:hypothetical protein n=1 Tax=Maribacter sp. X9 TaxID=3402159 RepID=UPI003AF3E476